MCIHVIMTEVSATPTLVLLTWLSPRKASRNWVVEPLMMRVRKVTPPVKNMIYTPTNGGQGGSKPRRHSTPPSCSPPPYPGLGEITEMVRGRLVLPRGGGRDTVSHSPVYQSIETEGESAI